jgi:hypothetical protein
VSRVDWNSLKLSECCQDREKTGIRWTMTVLTMTSSRLVFAQTLLCLSALFRGAGAEIRPFSLLLEPAVCPSF